MRLLQAEPSCESYESSTLLTSGKKGVNEDRRGRGAEVQVRVFLLEPRRLWVKSCVQRLYSLDAAVITVPREARHTAVGGVSLRPWRLRSRYLYPRRSIFSLLINQGVQTLPFCSGV